MAGGQTPTSFTTEQVITFGGIPDPNTGDRRVNHRIQGQADAVDLQLGRAMRAAKLRDVEASTGMSMNTSNSILHFSEHDIIDKASNLGISLGSTPKEIVKSVNELLDLETDRALDIVQNLAAVKPMDDLDFNNLGISALQRIFKDLIPKSGMDEEDEEEEMVSQGYVAPWKPSDELVSGVGQETDESMQDKPKRPWKRKIYPTSAIRRSAHIKQKK